MSDRQDSKLHEAVRSGDVSKVSRLLNRNADVNAKDNIGYWLDKFSCIVFE